MQWYYARNGKTHGPLNDAELFRMAQTGALRRTDYVWNETMGDRWAEASTVTELFPAQSQTPPLPAGGTPPPRPARAYDGLISCTAPIGQAWAGMKTILFRPFDMKKWFLLGFSVWLATLGEGGGANFSNPAKSGETPNLKGAIDTWHAQVAPFIKEHAAMIALIAIVTVLLVVALSMLTLWVKSRGRFMFLDNVVNDRAEIQHPWQVFAQHGNSLFWWTFWYGLVCFGIGMALLTITCVSVAVPWIQAGSFARAVIPGIVLSGVLWLLFGIATGYIGRFLNDFVVPLMYRNDLTAREAWSRFMPLFKAHAGAFIVYGLMVLALSILAGLCVLALVVVTCCIAGCLMAIPYVGTVLILPIPVFFRLYSLEYLAQFGPDFTVEPGA
jgi:hypothetical protein